MSRKAKLSEIRLFHRFRPKLSVWVSHMDNKSFISFMPFDTWYDGYWFNCGLFILIQLKFFAIHIKFTWWRLTFGAR